MNLLNLIEDTTTGYDNLRALMQASQSGQDAVLTVGGETVTLDPMETRWMFGKYKAFNKAGRQEEFLNHLADPVKFDQHMKQLRQLIDKQKNFRGSVPGERGVEENIVAGIVGHEIKKFLDEPTPNNNVAEEEAVEEIAMNNPDQPTAQTAGKINWERMIKDYMDNKPYSEFEFPSDRPLTLYRSQVYAILKDFGRMKPQQKVNLILNTFGDKYAMVDYIDKLRSKGMMPKKVPAYKAPGVEAPAPGQMTLPGMDVPKIKEAQAQKKNSDKAGLDRDTAINPRVARALQLARARQSAAGSDIEAFVQDELEKAQSAQAQIDQLEKDNQQQADQISRLSSQLSQQDQEIQQIKSQPEPEPQSPAPAVQPAPTPAPAEPDAKAQPAPKSTEPAKTEPTAEPQPVPVPQRQPAPKAKKTPKKRTTRKKAPATTPDNVIPFPGKKKTPADDELSAALQGVDMDSDDLFARAVGMNEDTGDLNVGDPVIIRGNVEFEGKTGDVAGFGRDKHFVIVDLYNFGKHAFHASNVKYNEYADQEVDEGRLKNDELERQWQAGQQATRSFQNRERTAGEEEPVGDFRVVRRKDGVVGDLKQHYSSNEAFRHARALKKKYPSMEVGVKWPTGQINWVGLTFEDDVTEMQTKLDRYNVNQPPPGGTNKQREQFLDARDKLFRLMKNASTADKEVIRLKIADLEAKAQAKGIKIREAGEFNRSGYNAIKDVSDWREKIRVMQELMKDRALMSDPEAKAAIEQRIGDLIRVGQEQGYVTEALSDKAMSVLRGLKSQPQATQPAAMDPAKQAEVDAWARDVERNLAPKLKPQAVAKPAIDLNVPQPKNIEDTLPDDLPTLQRRIKQLDELIKMKEMIDKLFLKAQNVRGGIYPGLQSDIEDEEMYGVPTNDQDFEELKNKYTRDLAALQKFLAMKKAVYREDEELVGESAALVRLQRARQQLAQQGVAEAQTDYQKRRQRERDVDAGKPVSRQPKNPQNDYFARRKKEKKHDMEEQKDKAGNPMYRREEVYMVVHNGKEVAFYKPESMARAYSDAEDLVKRFGGEAHVKKVMREAKKKDRSPGKITKSEDPCWSGYHMVGKKIKNGREVPNCVPGKKG